MSGLLIRIFLVDGIASGLRTADLGLSTVKALVVPRASLSAATKRPEVHRTGVYILIGHDSDKPGVLKIYLGEGDTVLTRLTAHNKEPEKDFWEEAVVFVSIDENLTKAHVRFLESRLIALAHEAKRCTVTNATEPPNQGRLPEADDAVMEQFIFQARLLLSTLGYDLFSPIQESSTQAEVTAGHLPSSPAAEVVFVYRGEGFSASCVVDPVSGKIVVRKDSKARKRDTASLQPTYKRLRERLRETGVLVEDTDSYRFTQDYAFNAPTPAAQVVSGQNVGPDAWRLPDGSKTYAEWQDAQLAKEA